MEADPPSYDYATAKDPWALIAPYVRSADLRSACLACKRWHQTFAPQLWGKPSARFTRLADDPWLGFRKFERIILSVARLEVRQLTHTLQLPTGGQNLYETIYSTKWLFNVLNRLPRLQSLLVPNVSSFDHEALRTLRQSTLPKYDEVRVLNATHDLLLSSNHMRLVDASNCRNVTSTSLRIAFEMLPNLMYLDLSGVPAASFAEVLHGIKELKHLKALILRRLRLTDAMMYNLAAVTGRRVRYIDVAENPTTEKSLTSLLQHCLVPAEEAIMSNEDNNANGNSVSDAPPSYERLDLQSFTRSINFEKNLFKALTSGHINRLALEDSSETGITHLRISMKSIAARTLFACFHSQHLTYLDIDCGSVDFSPQVNILHQRPRSLKYLRIHHSLITGLGTRTSFSNQGVEMPESLERIIEMREAGARNGQTNFENITASLPSLKHLALTDIPSKTTDPVIASRLISLLSNCATNANLARAQSRKELFSEHASKSRALGQERRAKILFPLETIVLELASTMSNLSKQKSRGWNYREDTKAVTEDRDSEALWTAAGTDFSFFENEEGSTAEPDVRLQKFDRSTGEAAESSAPSNTRPLIDVVGDIVAYRKSSRQKYEQACANGKEYDLIHEFWTGTVRVVRS